MTKFLILLALTICILSSSSVLAYDYTGVIYENGDSFWDENEINFIKFEIDEGETLEIEFASLGELELMVCDCNDKEDIEGYLEEMFYEGTIPDDLYLWMDSYSYTSGSVYAERRIDVSVAIFSYDPSNPSSMSYTLTTNLPKGDRISNTPSFITIVIVLSIIVVIIYLVKRNKQSKSTSYPTNYSSSYGEPQYAINQSNPLSSDPNTINSAKFCTNCGNQTSTQFCTQCGSRVS